MTLRSAIGRLAVIAIAALFIVVPRSPSYADPSPFDTLLGSWGGSGEIRLDKGRKERSHPAAQAHSATPCDDWA